MSYLAHKISRSKWDHQSFMKLDDISSDALTSCLRTRNNQLSFWNCKTTSIAEVEIIALALAGGMERIDSIDIVLIPKRVLNESQFQFEQNPGSTAVTDLKDLHVDMVQLTAKKLCQLVSIVAPNVRNSTSCFRFTRTKMLGFLSNAINEDRVELEKLFDKVTEQLNRHNA